MQRLDPARGAGGHQAPQRGGRVPQLRIQAGGTISGPPDLEIRRPEFVAIHGHSLTDGTEMNDRVTEVWGHGWVDVAGGDISIGGSINLNRSSSRTTVNSDFIFARRISRIPSTRTFTEPMRQIPPTTGFVIEEATDVVPAPALPCHTFDQPSSPCGPMPGSWLDFDSRHDAEPSAPTSPDEPFHNMNGGFPGMGLGESSAPSATSHQGPGIGGRRRSPKEFVIAVMGKTGSGKSTFISKLSNRDYQSSVGHGLSSRTQQVVEIDCSIDGCSVVLVDTPGFDDTHHEDGTILSRIGHWLDLSYHEGKRLSGLIYMHDITEPRMGRSNVRNMTLFRKITGQDNMKNVILLTTKWEILPDQATGVRRERDLHEEPGFWNQMLADDAQSRRHDGTKQSAMAIVRVLLKKDPVILKMQQQMADGANLVDTEAGEFVNDEYLRLQRQHQEDMEKLKLQMMEAEEKNKVKLADALRANYKKLLDEVEASKEQQAQLMNQQKETLEKRLQDAEKKLKYWQSERKAVSKKAKQEQEQLRKTVENLQQEASKLRSEIVQQRKEAQTVVLRQQQQLMAQERKRSEECERETQRLREQEAERRVENAAANVVMNIFGNYAANGAMNMFGNYAANGLMNMLGTYAAVVDMAVGIQEHAAIMKWKCVNTWCYWHFSGPRVQLLGTVVTCNICGRTQQLL